jgi:hypothetical protein
MFNVFSYIDNFITGDVEEASLSALSIYLAVYV